MAAVASTVPSSNPWLRSAWWDTAFVSFVWVPYYLWIALRPPSAGVLLQAVLVHAVATFVHRQYVFVMVYGDKETFAQRRAFILAPIIVAVPLLVALAFAPQWIAFLFIVDRLWSVWHSVMQKYGIWRIYAAKARGGLETRAHARRDRIFLLAQYAALLAILVVWRRETLAFNPKIAQLLGMIDPYLASPLAHGCAFAVLGGAGVATAIWVVHELRAAKASTIAPRWSFLVSLLMLYVITIIHGPIVGHLVFGTSHALEYIAFAHHFGEKKYGGESKGSLARVLLRSARRAPLLIGGLGAIWLLTRRFDGVPAWMAMIYATGALHYLYDGWIWKVRAPSVAKPLGLAPTT